MSRALPSEWKKLETNSDLQSEVMCVGMPCLERTWRRNSLASSGAVMVSCVGMKTHCFERWSTTTKMAVNPEDAGSCSMKSIEMEFHRHLGIGSCFSKPYSLWWGALARVQAVHEDT